MEVKIVDDIMGKGKTTAMIQYINKNANEESFIFITPFLSECERIKRECKNFQSPLNINDITGKKISKVADFKRLLKLNANIVATHALFFALDEECVELIKERDYILILDEVLDVVTETSLSATELDIFKSLKLINQRKERNGTVRFEITKDKNLLKKYAEHHKYADLVKNMIRNTIDIHKVSTDINGKIKAAIFIWLFPVDFLTAFKDVYILTFCFDGYPLKYYLDMHNIEQKKYSIKTAGLDDYANRLFLLSEDEPDCEFQKKIKNNIKIIDGTKINKIGDERSAFSVGWVSKNFKDESIVDFTSTIYYVCSQRFSNRKYDDILWTCFESEKNKLYVKAKLINENFLAHNARATNDYRHKKSVIYLCNKFYNPVLKNYLTSKGLTVNEDMYALGELLQFVFRSAIRDGKEIELYIPSSRMRNLLEKWIDGEL